MEGLLGKIETLLAEAEEAIPAGITSKSLAEIFEDTEEELLTESSPLLSSSNGN